MTVIKLFVFCILIVGFTRAGFAQHGDAGVKITKGVLTETEFSTLKTILKNYTITINDTIIIKYDFNHDDCWSMLDRQSADYIEKVISQRQAQVKSARLNRPGITVLEVREKGNDFSKMKKWNKEIIIDTTKELYRLLIRKKSSCGSSVLVLPDRRFILTRSDSHFNALNYKKEEVDQFLR